MNRIQKNHWGRKVITRIAGLVLAVTLLVGGVPATGTPVPAQRVQPQLLSLVYARPDATVNVIIQKSVQDTRIEELIPRLGGVVTKDLHIINAVGARVPVGAVQELGRANAVRWVSLDGPVESTGKGGGTTSTPTTNYYLDTLGVRQVWNAGYQGQGITVAVVDSGVSSNKDFSLDTITQGGTRILRQQTFNPTSPSTNDIYGHGSHVAGIVAGNGSLSSGQYQGIAPKANLDQPQDQRRHRHGLRVRHGQCPAMGAGQQAYP